MSAEPAIEVPNWHLKVKVTNCDLKQDKAQEPAWYQVADGNGARFASGPADIDGQM